MRVGFSEIMGEGRPKGWGKKTCSHRYTPILSCDCVVHAFGHCLVTVSSWFVVIVRLYTAQVLFPHSTAAVE